VKLICHPELNPHVHIACSTSRLDATVDSKIRIALNIREMKNSKPTARKAGSAAVMKHGSEVGLYGYRTLSRFVKDGVLDLSLLAGGRFIDTSLGELSGQHGVLNIDQSFMAELIKPLPEPAIDDLIDNHPFVMIDLGVRHLKAVQSSSC
jgi:hypothetical protein